LQTLRNAWLQGTSDPRFDRFLVNNESLLRAWVRAMNPTGQPRVGQEMTARAEGVLSKAVGLRGYEAMLDALWQEVQASREAVEDVRAGRAPPNPFEGTAPITAPARRWPTPPPAAIEDLRKAPATRDKFDEIFGPGAAGRALGGA
jgi:hypothetical protein